MEGLKHQTLLGVTGSGKTFTMANVIARWQRPTLVISHNKTLAAQLYPEFKEFFPDNAVEYFVSYYDYYQPEAYVPATTCTSKKRPTSTRRSTSCATPPPCALLSGATSLSWPPSPASTASASRKNTAVRAVAGKRQELSTGASVLRRLVDMQYERNDIDFSRGKFRIRGDTLEISPPTRSWRCASSSSGRHRAHRLEIDPLTGEILAEMDSIDIYPAKHFVTSQDKLKRAIEDIKAGAGGTADIAEAQGKMVEAAPAGSAHQLRHGDAAGNGLLLRRGELLAAPVRAPPGSRTWTLWTIFRRTF